RAGSNRARLGFGRPTTEEVELLFEARVAVEDLGLVLAVAMGHVGSSRLHLADDAIEPSRSEDPVARDDGQIACTGILRKVSHRGGTSHRAGRRERLAREHPCQGRLARAITPDEPDPVAGRDLEGHRLEELATSGCEFQVGGSDHEGPVFEGRWRCVSATRATAYATSN